MFRLSAIDRTIDAYLAKVAGQIRVKRAREPLIHELRDHMELQAQDYQDAGMEKSAAQRKAVEDMGDALLVGGELDRVHRPRVQWKGLILTIAMLCAGLLLQASLEHNSLAAVASGKQFYGALICAGLILLVSLSDYTWWVRLAVPVAALWLLLWAFRIYTFLSLGWVDGRFYANIAYSQSALEILFISSTPEWLCRAAPALSTLLACAMRGRGWGGFALCLAAPVLTAVMGFTYRQTGWNANIMTLLALLALAVLFLAVRREFFQVRHRIAYGLLAAVALPTLILFLRYFFVRFQPQDALSEWVLPLLRGARWIGQGRGTVFPEMSMNNDFLLALAIHRLGWIPFILFTMGIAAVLILCLRRFARMENLMGALVGLAATATLAVQVFAYYLCSFTSYAENICLPLMSYGSVVQAGDALIVGLILSILRGQNVPETSSSRPANRALA